MQGTGDMYFLPFPVQDSTPWRLCRTRVMSPPPPWAAGSSTALCAKSIHPKLFPVSTSFVQGHDLSSSSHPGQLHREHSSFASLGTSGTPCRAHISLWRGAPGSAPHAGVRTQAPCSCLQRAALVAGNPECTVAKGMCGEAAPCRGSKKTLFPAKFFDTFPFTQLRLEKHRGPRDFPPSR